MQQMWRWMMGQGVLLGMLGLCAVEDLRKKRVTLSCLALFGLFAICYHASVGDMDWVGMLLGAAVGLALIGLSVLTDGSIGMGDGFLFLVTGIFLGGGKNMELLMLSLLYAALFSLGLIVFGKVKGKMGRKEKEIPFIPFVFLGYATMLLEEAL